VYYIYIYTYTPPHTHALSHTHTNAHTHTHAQMKIPTGGIFSAICYSIYESRCVTQYVLLLHIWCNITRQVTQVAWPDIWKALVKRNHTKRKARNELFLYIGWHSYLICDSSCVTQYMRFAIYKALVKRNHTTRLAQYVLFLYIGWQRHFMCDSSCVTQYICDLIHKKLL